MNNADTPLRLSKLMSQLGLSSRREADKLIEQGLVMVNGEVVKELGSKVLPTDKVEILSRGQKILDSKLTLILNKPIGLVSSQPEDGYESAMTLLQINNRILNTKDESLKLNLKNMAPTGRLDIDSKGLIIYTQDGVVAKKIIGENSTIDKEYIVQFNGVINDEKLQKLRHGLSLDDIKLREAKVELINSHTLNMVLKQGRKRQIRRMLKLVDLHVTHLKRVRIGPIELESLEDSKWRLLTKDEIKKILEY